MRQGVLFRIRHVLVSIAFFFLLNGPANALWLDVTGTSYPVQAPLTVSLEGKEPPKGDQSHGLYALPPSYRDPNPFSVPKLKLQYRADFPLSVTFETDGAVGGDRVAPTGALNFGAKVIFSDKWWSPVVSASLADFSLEQMAHGKVEVGQSGLRSEWKLKF